MKVLLVGSGAREHALAWKLRQSPLLEELHCVPGSGALRALAYCPALKAEDHDAVAGYCAERGIGLVVVGPEAPLAAGLADSLRGRGLKVFGPKRQGAQLESSKEFAKRFMQRNGIPTAACSVFGSPEEARRGIKANRTYPVVIKADGLAAGKGVRICAGEAEALAAVEDFMERRVYGGSGDKVVMEEFLTGREASVMALTDGRTLALLPVSRDHKRLRDGDAGPNTGGMGAVCPVELPAAAMAEIKAEVLGRFLAGLKAEGIDYRGVIYAGLMLTPKGPKVLEFNVRFGDPETEALLPAVKTDLLPLFDACARGELGDAKIELTGETCVAVVAAAAGYPEAPEKGRAIKGLAEGENGALVFHAGTALRAGEWTTAGGRVLAVCAGGPGLEAARAKAYAALGKISFEGMQYRKDIGL